MWTSNKIIALAALWSVLPAAHAADELVFRGAGREKLSGTVTSIEESGVIVLTSPLSDEPLRLRPNSVERVNFGAEEEGKPPAAMLVELTNGDRLPVELKSFSAKAGMHVSSPVVGDIVLPVSALGSLELGVPERKLVFEGPGETEKWKSVGKNGFQKVQLEGKDWLITGPLDVSRQIELPKNFVLRFQAHWDQRQQPNIKLYFASPDVNTVTKADRYFLQFGGAGFEIKREKTNGSGFASVLVSGRRPDEFAGKVVDIEIHVNRMTKRIDLFLNGQFEAWGLDPMAQAPEGSGLILTTNGMAETTHAIRNLTVHELDNARIRHRAEDRGSPDKDSLITRDEDRWAGELLEIRPSGDELEFIFQTTIRREPFDILLERVSTVFFRKPDGAANKEPTKYRLQLRGEGVLSAKSCRIAGQNITVVHPLLGELHLHKDSILGIEPTAQPENKGEKSE